MNRFSVIVLSCFLVIGCANSGNQFVQKPLPEEEKALVFVYHPKDYKCEKPLDKLLSESNFLFINDRKIFSFPCDTYTALVLNPGTYRFSIKENLFYLPSFEKQAQTYIFKKGKTYYIKYTEDFDLRHRSTTRAYLEKSERDTPPPDIVNCSYRQPSTTVLE